MNTIPPNVPLEVDSIPKDSKVQILRNYINGEWVDTEKYIQNLNPATSEILSYIPRSQKEDVQKACRVAKEAFKSGSWSDLDEEQRAKFLEKIADKIEENFDKFVEAESQDNGKPVTVAKMTDIPRAIANFRFFAGAIKHASTDTHYMGTKVLNYTVRRPIGPCGLIAPWNLPIYLLSWKIAPALACGNTVVCKPSELTPMTANLLAEVIHEVGLPKGTFNLVHGYGREAGQAIVESEDISLVSFTGGTATGVQVAKTASSQFKKLSLELGGKNSMIVFDDCDFDKSVDLAVKSGFSNQGEICLCCSRLFVQESIYDKFVDAYIKKVSEIKIGDPSKKETQMGSLISIEHRQKIEYYTNLAQEEGGKILFGGKIPEMDDKFSKGAFYMPTVVSDLKPSSRTSTEEIFGPIVTIHKFKDENEVLDYVNLVRYGLCASVLTSNLKIAHKFSDKLQVGMVWVNCWLLRDLRVPFGGVKDSGIGREGGNYSLEFYSEDKNICVNLDF
jgi:aminomuconate-semialdehyde/2-hydroxymuconate-6-semialdehyde dehydrogenase